MKIKTIGYYISEPFHWIDWHAGIKFEGDNYNVIKFDLDRCFFDSVNNIDQIDIKSLSKRENYGLYKIYNTIIEIKYNPNTEFEVKRTFTMLSPNILLDEELKEYKYVE
jgi:hypothetical protein